jgi:isoleucyl-tRNA synthetase
LINRITESFRREGADAWYKPGAAEAYLKGVVDDPAEWEKVDDILDVWFESGCTHAFCLEQRPDLKWPADLYLEGSDQHRGWFHSSLLESCGTRGRAPYNEVLTHGFVMAEDGRKMSKSLGNVVTPQDVIKQSGADILRLWVMSSDYSDDLRIGPEILKANVESYRKLRNTLRWSLGNLAHFDAKKRVEPEAMPELERYMLTLLAEHGGIVREGYRNYDFKRVFQALSNFCIVDLSAFYFDIRKDTLYCEPEDSSKRLAALTVLDRIFDCLTIWLAPMVCFTAEEAWLARHPSDAGSVHLQLAPEIPVSWSNRSLAEKWQEVRSIRRVVTGALELERAAKRIGSSLEAAPIVTIDDKEVADALEGIDLAELCITSDAKLVVGPIPGGAFRLPDVRHVGVTPAPAQGKKCERSWRITPDVGSDPAFPTLSARDAAAVRQWDVHNGR